MNETWVRGYVFIIFALPPPFWNALSSGKTVRSTCIAALPNLELKISNKRSAGNFFNETRGLFRGSHPPHTHTQYPYYHIFYPPLSRPGFTAKLHVFFIIPTNWNYTNLIQFISVWVVRGFCRAAGCFARCLPLLSTFLEAFAVVCFPPVFFFRFRGGISHHKWMKRAKIMCLAIE